MENVTLDNPPNSIAAQLTAAAVRWRWLLLTAGLILGALSWYPAQQLSFNRSLENMFAADDPLLPPFARLKRTFGNHEIVLAAYADPLLLTQVGLERIEQLAAALEQVPGVDSVLSLNRGPLGLAIQSDTPHSRAFLELFEGFTVGADRQTAAVVCLLKRTSDGDQTAAIDRIRETTEAHDANGVIVGEPVMVADGFRYLEEDGWRLRFVSTGLVVLTMLICFRSLRWVLIPLAVVQLALLMTLAALVTAGLRLTMVSSMLAANITIIGVATIVHLVIHFREARGSGLESKAALIATAGLLAGPIASACLTDCVGFGSLVAARVGPVHDFGLMMLVGSLMVLLSLILLVPGLALLGSRDRDPRRAWGEGAIEVSLSALSSFVERRSAMLGIASIVVLGFSAVGCWQTEIETDFTRNFRRDSPLVRAYEFVEERLGGAGVWDAIVPAPQTLDRAFLEQLSRIEHRLRTEVTILDDQGQPQPGLTKVLSIADIVETGTLGADKLLPEAFRDAALNQAVLQVHKQMPDFAAAMVGSDPAEVGSHYVRIMLRSQERLSADNKQRLINQVTAICTGEVPGSQVTGYFVLLASLIDSTTRDQWVTFSLSTAGILVMMLIAFRSLKLALVALVPNTLPILLVTGLMGWTGLKINMGAAMIAAVSLGLSVDSSVHYITEYLRLRRNGLTPQQALSSAHLSVGRAMVFSTLALVVGFSALCLSQFVPTIYFGALVGLTMLGGLAGNLLLLPMLLLLVDRGDRQAAPAA